MYKILRPMLAGKCEIDKLDYPIAVTPKIDGIRCIIQDGKALSRAFKLIPNKYIQSQLSILPNGLDGELIATIKPIQGKIISFQESTSAIMSEEGNPWFQYIVFDYVKDTPIIEYTNRIHELEQLILPDFCKILIPTIISNREELAKELDLYLKAGYEGIMIRNPKGEYKFGRSSTKEGLLLKLKPSEDSEAIILDMVTEYENLNTQEKDNFGYKIRKTKQEFLIEKDTLGSLLVKDAYGKWDNKPFHIGTGFTMIQRKEIWDNKSKYLYSVIKYKYQPIGILDLPRFPVFLGFRDMDY